MTRQDKVTYWLRSAEEDWKVSGHLFDMGDFAYALFFAHLTIEKLLKGVYAAGNDDPPPFSHRLVFLAQKAALEVTSEQLDLLETVTDFNMEARYPDENFSFQRKCTKRFTSDFLQEIEDLRRWLVTILES